MGKIVVRFLLVVVLVIAAGPVRAADPALAAWERAEKAYAAGRYREAKSLYEKSLSMCRGNLECVTANLNGIGVSLEALGDEIRALDYYEKAIASARKLNNRDLIATNLFNAGAVYYGQHLDYEKAYAYLDESRSLFRALGDEDSLAFVLHKLGRVAAVLGRYEKALSFYEESNRINRRKKEFQAVAANLILIGNVYASLGRYEKPLALYQEALSINERLGNPKETAIALRNIGDAYADLMQFEKAIPYYEKALRTQERHNLRRDMATTLNNMGALYGDINEREKAVRHYERALEIAEGFRDTALISVALSNLGHKYSENGEFEKAFACYDRALKLEKRPLQQAILYNNIGMLHFKNEDYDRALDELSRALSIERRLGNPHAIAYRLNNIGAVYLRQKRYGDAEKVFLERRRLQAKMTKNRLIHAGLIQTHIEQGRWDEALSLLKELPPVWRDRKVRHMEYHTQYGRVLMGKAMAGEAALEFLEAVRLVEQMRYGVEERTAFFAGGGYIERTEPYRRLVAALLELAERNLPLPAGFPAYGNGPAAAAFYFAELTRARTLLETMAASARKGEAAGVDPGLRAREKKISEQLAVIERTWEKTLQKGEAAVREAAAKRDRLQAEMEAVVRELRERHPRYAALHYPVPAPVEKIPLGDREVLFEYVLNEEAGHLLVIGKGGLRRQVRIPVPRARLEEMVKGFTAPMHENRPERFSVSEGKRLYETLLAEAMKSVSEGEKIVIVPDGILGLLPFEALVVEENGGIESAVYAGDRHPVSYYPSATVLALQRVLSDPSPEKPLFALGNPVYSALDPRYIAWKEHRAAPPLADPSKHAFRGIAVNGKWAKAAGPAQGREIVFPPLPETEDEVRAIAEIMEVRPEPPQVLLSVAASETGVKAAALEKYRYLHFATHASLPGMIQKVREPFILLGQVENRGEDDGFLELGEVLDFSLNAELVVLSACVTGVGREVEGEGVVNFARVFQQAGARGVVVSLWEVASEPAVEYMTTLYRNLKAGSPPAEALRRSRTAIREKYKNPLYWAVFILHGEG